MKRADHRCIEVRTEHGFLDLLTYDNVADILDGIEFLSEQDLLDLLGEDSREATDNDAREARFVLDAHGYREQSVAFFGRSGFRRFVKTVHDPGRPRVQVPVFGYGACHGDA